MNNWHTMKQKNGIEHQNKEQTKQRKSSDANSEAYDVDSAPLGVFSNDETRQADLTIAASTKPLDEGNAYCCLLGYMPDESSPLAYIRGRLLLTLHLGLAPCPQDP
jgi:hypothetical protein